MGLYRRKEDGSQNWWVSYTIAGKRIRESTKTSNRKDAERFLAERLVGNTVPVKSSIGALLNALVTDYEVNGKSVEWCSQYVEKHIRPFFGDIKAERLDRATIKTFMKQMLDDGYANATINRCVALLHRSFTLADCKFPRIEKLEENNVRKGFVDEERFFVLLERLPVHQRALALFGFETGCRKGEILKLKWEQIDFIRNVVRLNPNETKNKQGRVIPLSELMMWFLKNKVSRCSDFVFTYRGKPLRSIRTGWDAAQGKGKDRLLFHDLRRSAIRNMVRAGVPERVAMAVSGHKSRSVFDRYNIVDEQDLSTAMESLTKGRKLLTVDTKSDFAEYVKIQREARALEEEEKAQAETRRREALLMGTEMSVGLDRDVINQLDSHRLPPKKSRIPKAS